MNDDLQKEVLKTLNDIRESQNFALGRIDALEAALGACLCMLRGQPEFLAHVQFVLETHHALLIQKERSLASRDGFEASYRQLLHDMGAEPPATARTGAGGIRGPLN